MAVLCICVKAQQPTIKPLTIGDAVPNITFNKVINYPKTTARLSDFKGKLVILDFWATTCPSCIAGFKKVNQLQRQYSDKVAFIFPNPFNAGDSLKKIKEVIDKKVWQNILDKDKIPVVAEDKIVSRLFPYSSLPHVVWIKDQKVLAITSADELTAENVAKVLKNPSAAYALTPKEDKVSFDPSKTLFSENYIPATDQPVLRSTVMGRVYGLNSSASIEYGKDKKQILGIALINNNPLDALGRAYPEIKKMVPAQIIIDKSAPGLIKRSYADTSDKINNEVISYELILAPTEAGAVLKMMQHDLCRYFNIKVLFEKRKVTSYILTRRNANDLSTSEGVKPDDNLYDDDDKPKYLHNKPLIGLIRKLNATLSAIVIDETGISRTPVTITGMPNDLRDVGELAKVLSKQGFDLRLEEKEMICAVIKGNQ